MADITPEFLSFAVSKLREFESRIVVCSGKLTEEQIWARGSANENSFGNLVLHLSGNIRQWIVATLGGQPDARDRDAEFAAEGGKSIAELLAHLHRAVEESVAVIESRTAEQLLAVYHVQVYDVTGVEAVFHVVEHFAMHTGQMIFLTKMLTGTDLAFYAALKKQQ